MEKRIVCEDKTSADRMGYTQALRHMSLIVERAMNVMTVAGRRCARESCMSLRA